MADLEDLFVRLHRSRFRRRFRLGPRERAYLADRGFDAIRDHARDFIARRVAPAAPINDGRQTPMRGHPVFVAQHATATCCRNCLKRWHRIDTGRPLTRDEAAYVVDVIMAWIGRQQPDARTPCSRATRKGEAGQDTLFD